MKMQLKALAAAAAFALAAGTAQAQISGNIVKGRGRAFIDRQNVAIGAGIKRGTAPASQ